MFLEGRYFGVLGKGGRIGESVTGWGRVISPGAAWLGPPGLYLRSGPQRRVDSTPLRGT